MKALLDEEVLYRTTGYWGSSDVEWAALGLVDPAARLEKRLNARDFYAHPGTYGNPTQNPPYGLTQPYSLLILCHLTLQSKDVQKFLG